MQRSSTCDLAANRVGFLRFPPLFQQLLLLLRLGGKWNALPDFATGSAGLCFLGRYPFVFGLLLLFLFLLLPDFGG